MSDPTYNRAFIDANPVDRLAFVLSELINESAPIGWARYRFPAELLIKKYAAPRPTEEEVREMWSDAVSTSDAGRAPYNFAIALLARDAFPTDNGIYESRDRWARLANICHKALHDFGQHPFECPAHDPEADEECDCGLDEALGAAVGILK